MRKGKIGAVALAVIMIIGLFCVFKCTEKVPTGYTGVVYNMRNGVTDEVIEQGFHVVSPTKSITLYSNALETSYLTSGNNGDSPNDESFSASSKEGKELIIDMTYNYRFDHDRITDVFKMFKGQSGKEVRDTFMKPNAVSWSKEVIATYKAADIIGDSRAKVNKDLSEYLAGKFEPYGIVVSNVSLINVDVDAETKQAINAKITAQQSAETQAINNQILIDKAAAEAEASVKAAEGEAEKKLIASQAKADALMIEAEAEAQANKKVAESLTPELIEKQKIDKWSGYLPYITGSDASTIINTKDFIGNIAE